MATSPSLIRRLRNREEAAWERMVVLYTPLIAYWCRRSQLSPEETEDITQDVFRTVAQSLDRFKRDKEHSTFRGWLRTIFRSRVVDHIRRNAAGPRGQGGSAALLRLKNVSDAVPEDADPGVQALFGRVMDLVRGEFSDSAWRAFWLTAVEERRARDVALELEMTPGAVRQAKYRILRRIREEMGDIE